MKTNNEILSHRTASHSCKMLLRSMLLLVVVFPFFACSTFGDKKKSMRDFSAAVEGFNTALRWGEYKMASAFVSPNLQEQFWRQADIMEKSIRLTDYDIRNVSTGTAGESFPVIIRFHYYITNDPHLQTQTVRQQWFYSEEAESWMITQSGLEALVER